MDWIFNVFWLFLIGVPGWFLLDLMKVPASAIMGAMLSAGFFTIMGWAPSAAPAHLNFLLQIVLGLFIGLKVSRDAGSVFRKMAPVALLAAVWWLALPLGLGWILSISFGLDFPTALLSTVPGGLSEMSLMALTLGADATVVALMQFFRLGTVAVGMPLISSWLSQRFECNEERADPGLTSAPEPPTGILPLVTVLSVATLGALIGTWMGLPSGGFVGALVLTGIASFLGIPLRPLPRNTRNLALLGLGSTIGLSATSDTVAALGQIIVPMIAITVTMLFWGMLLAVIVRRTMKWNMMTCLLASAPGGVTALSAISEEIGANPLYVSLLHLVRLFSIFLLLPPIIRHLAQ
jgi:membrane AbrB-like protein